MTCTRNFPVAVWLHALRNRSHDSWINWNIWCDLPFDGTSHHQCFDNQPWIVVGEGSCVSFVIIYIFAFFFKTPNLRNGLHFFRQFSDTFSFSFVCLVVLLLLTQAPFFYTSRSKTRWWHSPLRTFLETLQITPVSHDYIIINHYYSL